MNVRSRFGRAAFVVAMAVFHKLSFGQMFAGYNEFCGVPVVVVANAQGASAAMDSNGNPVIFVDPGVMANWTTSRMFALAHECGHHVLGHTLPNGMWFRNTRAWATRQQELQADCWAAEQLANLSDERDLRRMIIEFAAKGPIPQGPYPSGRERSYAVAECAGIELEAPTPPSVPYCCDAFGNRRCVIQLNAGPEGSVCGCVGQGYGITCY